MSTFPLSRRLEQEDNRASGLSDREAVRAQGASVEQCERPDAVGPLAMRSPPRRHRRGVVLTVEPVKRPLR